MSSDFGLSLGQRKDRVVKVDDIYPAQVTLAKSASNQVVASVTCPPNLRPILKKLGNIVNDATGANYITWTLLVNGGKWSNFEAITSEMTDPAVGDEFLPYETPLPTGCTVQLVASSTDTASTHPVVGRLVIYYVAP